MVGYFHLEIKRELGHLDKRGLRNHIHFADIRLARPKEEMRYVGSSTHLSHLRNHGPGRELLQDLFSDQHS